MISIRGWTVPIQVSKNQTGTWWDFRNWNQNLFSWRRTRSRTGFLVPFICGTRTNIVLIYLELANTGHVYSSNVVLIWNWNQRYFIEVKNWPTLVSTSVGWFSHFCENGSVLVLTSSYENSINSTIYISWWDWYLHPLEWGLLVVIFNPANVTFALRDPDLVEGRIFTLVRCNLKKDMVFFPWS